MSLTQQLDIFSDRTRKTIQAWTQAYITAELRRTNGNVTYPVKKTLQDIYDYAMLDPHLCSVIQQRASKTLAEDWAVFGEDENINEDATKVLDKKWFSKIQAAVIEARFYGYNLIEVQELIDSEIKDIKVISRGNVIPELKAIVKTPFQVNAGSLIPFENRNDSDYYMLVDTESLGILNQVVPLVMIKRTTLSMWGEHAQTYSLPVTMLKTDNLDQVQKYQQDLQRFLVSRNIVVGTSDEFSILNNSSSSGQDIYKELIEACNSEISKAIIGQTMTTDNGSSRSQSEVHERVANEVAEADREFMAYIINDVVFPKLVNLGYPLLNSRFKYISKEKRSFKEKLETVKTLKESGYIADPADVKSYLDLPFDLQTSTETGNSIEDSSKGDIKASTSQKKSLYVTEIEQELDSLYSQQCGECSLEDGGEEGTGVISNDYDPDDFEQSLQSLIDSMANDIYFNRETELSTDYVRRIAELFNKEVYNAFNFEGNFNNPDFDTQDLEFIQAIRKHNYYFAGGKNKVLAKSFAELVLDEDNEVRSFSKFKKECQEVGLKFNRNYLKTEYQTAISNAQSAAEWNSFVDDDILQYSATMDKVTRPEHARLNGLQLKRTDRLWNSIAPVNSWNCRCRLLVVPNGRSAKLTSTQRKEFRKLADKDFAFNPGTEGKLFPDNHPYLKILTEEDKRKIDSMIE